MGEGKKNQTAGSTNSLKKSLLSPSFVRDMNHRKLFILANETLLKQGDSAAQTPLPHSLFSTRNPPNVPWD